ncbi:MAG: adenylyl-sulfate reductase [Gammaproteobacteria bacterium]|nr:adenylyl-sulfate reductase [Gammaproteobacteria bacterium]MDH3536060.1 adenylyl-sulfate reductase [Gammaproteobacteria bacterium]
MFSQNPFAEVSASIPSALLQWFVVIMVVLVVAGTMFDVVHKKSARYFSESMRRSREAGTKQVSGGEVVSLAIQTAVSEVLTSSEFCHPNRRIAHLLTMYGLVIHLLATAVLVFGYPAMANAGIWPLLWHLGALGVCVGGYWFWFFIRVDVAAEGNSPFRVMRADLFILSLLASSTLALVWSAVQAAGTSVGSYIFFSLYLIATAVLFGGVPWSKFAHMFFKPAAALQKHVAEASGARDNLPPPADQPEQFGLGIKRELPRHY